MIDAKEKEQWRLLGAMLAMNGLLAAGNSSHSIPDISFKIADDMLEHAEQNSGIVSVKKRGKR